MYISKRSQIEKILVFRKVVERITYSKNSLEVVISLQDKTSSLLAGGGVGFLGGRAARIRLRQQNPARPTGDTRFDVQSGGLNNTNPNFIYQTLKLVTHHNLSKPFHLRKRKPKLNGPLE